MRARGIVLTAVLLLWGSPALAQTVLPASSADRIIEGDQPTGTFGEYVASAGDVDGDGYDDVLIGDESYDGTFPDSGRITIHRGSMAGLSPAHAWILEGGAAGARLSRAFPAGDVNGDGFDDVIAGTPAVLFTHLGSPVGPLPASWAQPGISLGHGDVNADGFSDIAVYSGGTISIFHGSAGGLDPAPSTTLPLPAAEQPVFLDGAVVEDLDGDGHDDLVFTWRYCARLCEYLIAEVRVHLGSDEGLRTRPKRTLFFRKKYENLFPFVASAGDANGDGLGDLALTVQPDLASPFGPDEVLWLPGHPPGLHGRSVLLDESVAGYLGPGSVDRAGDLNGDGFADLAVPHFDLDRSLPQSIRIYTGGPEGYSAVPALSVESEQAADAQFRGAATSAGDVNGDGLGDLIIGAPRYFSGGLPVGRVYVFHGSPAL